MIKGIQIGNLKNFEKILKKWQKLMIYLPKTWERDNPWWYRERTWIGFLSGAAWLTHNWAREEYSCSKVDRRRNRRVRARKAGRADLSLGIGRQEYLIEAKHRYINIDGRTSIELINKALKTVKRDVKRVPRKHVGQQRIMMLGITPILPISKSDNARKLINSLLDRMIKFNKCTIAWVFPDLKGNKYNKIRGYDYYYPGAILILRKTRNN